MRTANTPGSHEATTPSGLGAAGVSSFPMSMGSPALSTRSVFNMKEPIHEVRIRYIELSIMSQII